MTACLFIKNLPPDAYTDDLEEFFEHFEIPPPVKMRLQPAGKTVTALIDFNSIAAVNMAISKMDQIDYDGNIITVGRMQPAVQSRAPQRGIRGAGRGRGRGLMQPPNRGGLRGSMRGRGAPPNNGRPAVRSLRPPPMPDERTASNSASPMRRRVDSNNSVSWNDESPIASPPQPAHRAGLRQPPRPVQPPRRPIPTRTVHRPEVITETVFDKPYQRPKRITTDVPPPQPDADADGFVTYKSARDQKRAENRKNRRLNKLNFAVGRKRFDRNPGNPDEGRMGMGNPQDNFPVAGGGGYPGSYDQYNPEEQHVAEPSGYDEDIVDNYRMGGRGGGRLGSGGRGGGGRFGRGRGSRYSKPKASSRKEPVKKTKIANAFAMLALDEASAEENSSDD